MKKALNRLCEDYVSGKGVNSNRVVLHSDLNNFFASVECKRRPELKDFPVAVCGNREDRHGIVLAKNEKAKKAGVKTAEAIWQAKQKCPSLIIVPPDYDEYMRYSALVKEIYCRYSDRVEGFGMDEAWIELTGDIKIKSLEDGERIAQEIRCAVKKETGLTVSVGVSDNKVFSKLASDYKKPDAVTVFGPFNYRETVGKIDIGEMLYVGRSTRAKLHMYGINTIEDMSHSSEVFMKSMLGKNGVKLFCDASGANETPVAKFGDEGVVKSVGNSVTLPYDLENREAVFKVLYALADKVAWRLRNGGFNCKTVVISVRSTSLVTTEKQMPVECTCNALEIARAAQRLYVENYCPETPVRSVGVRASNLVSRYGCIQTSLFDGSFDRRRKIETLDDAVDKIRLRYGMKLIKAASIMNSKNTFVNVDGAHPAFSSGSI